ncbi:hypothetical protein XH87_23550 [Bradyrhizobium sp. CCBAU 53415]|nr:hypothetical protein [Bradyrhizobium sp. CCBAU 53415]
MGKQPEKKTANAPDKLFVFGLDEDGKPRGARFAEFNEKVVSAAAQMKLASVHPASAAVTEIGMKLPVGRLMQAARHSCHRSGVTSWRNSKLRSLPPETKAKFTNPRRGHLKPQRMRKTNRGFWLRDCHEVGTASRSVTLCWCRTTAQKNTATGHAWS